MARVQSLDVLRGIAVLMVLVAHAFDGRLAMLGEYGVDLFFMLSGYLISGLLFAELDATGRLRLGRFWLRRGLKIWPSYFVSYGLMLSLLCIRDLRHGVAMAPRLHDAIPNLVFLQNYWRPETRWLGSWSLAVEEHFYFALPLVLIIARRRITWICVVSVIACPVLRAAEWWRHPDIAATTTAIQTHFRVDMLCWGVLVRALHIRVPDFGNRSPLRWLAVVGVYSYTIYLAQAIVRATPLASGIAFMIASLVVGVIVSHVIERPMLRWRARILP